MAIIYNEYNTDSSSGTYERFQQIARYRATSPQNPSLSPLFISQHALASFTCDLFAAFQRNLVSGLSSKAIKRLQRPGRWKEVSSSSLICEIVTDKLIRKGPLSDAGRQQRCNQIRHGAERGKVEFAVLLLPFRTPSPLKHRGVLPDLGEIYTLVLLQSIAMACEHAQENMIETCRLAAASLTGSQLASFDQHLSPSPAKLDLNEVLARAFAIIDAQCSSRTEAAGRRQCVRDSLYNLKSINVRDGASFAELLAALSKWSLSLAAFNAFRNVKVATVTISAIQDAGRYPCFSNLNKAAIADYRKFLLEMMELLHIEPRHLVLVDYGDVAGSADQTMRKKRDVFYASRFQAFFDPISTNIRKLLSCNGKKEFMQLLNVLEVDGIVAPLFEPLLFSILQSRIGAYALEHGCDDEDIYFQVMENIYRPQSAANLEQLRTYVVSETLESACRYCAAYEANTGSKNPQGFDDVLALFPRALRMSIHGKDESIGHFSISVSPTGNRTPWHGTAALSEDKRSSFLDLSIDLVGHLEFIRQYRPVLVEAADMLVSGGVFERHARSGQPIFYLSPGLSPADAEGTRASIWSELARRGLRNRTQSTQLLRDEAGRSAPQKSVAVA